MNRKFDESILSPHSRHLLSELRRSWDNLTHYQRAVHEKLLWDSVGPDVRKQLIARGESVLSSRAEFFHATLPGNPTFTVRRSALLGYGQVVKPLWNRIDDPDEQMPITTAIGICRSAREALPGNTRKNAVLTAEGLERSIQQYDAQPEIRRQKNGGWHRWTPAGKMPAPKDPKKAKKRGRRRKKAGTNWDTVRAEIRKGILARLGDNEEDFVVESLYHELEHELKGLIMSFGERIAIRRRIVRDRQELSERALRKRCEADLAIFGLVLPRNGAPFDIKTLRRNYRKQAAVYHPDRHPEALKEVMQDKFRGITETYERLLAWHDHATGNNYPKANTLTETEQAS